ncbi:hypothetical protein AJ80_00625 [Polytolypa hystricis UAMH7299]|uniref:Uncharacterized protein n=1 Tax=Polytolypa hystricis (strain UAMH7299) TaxID=1447883 RepID=A0A2B7Z3H8_POLH7|nr:hypothetical protein AJ80_00625 [Polytolypa hystricis UAMH7299]
MSAVICQMLYSPPFGKAAQGYIYPSLLFQEMDTSIRKIRRALFTFYLHHCRPPAVDELASAAGEPQANIKTTLSTLQDLQPYSSVTGIFRARYINNFEKANPTRGRPHSLSLPALDTSELGQLRIRARVHDPLPSSILPADQVTITVRSGSIWARIDLHHRSSDRPTNHLQEYS